MLYNYVMCLHISLLYALVMSNGIVEPCDKHYNLNIINIYLLLILIQPMSIN